jgi:hypothetical protein
LSVKNKSKDRESALGPDDFYYNQDGLMVFTGQYLLNRGYCCENNCKHCPYPKKLDETITKKG